MARRIAEVALWLMDHQMNIRLSEAFGQLYRRLPLKKSPHIHQANALRVDWKEVLPPGQCSYLLGNPPFVGKHLMTTEQEQDMQAVWGDTNGAGFLDYVTGWYVKAAQYIQGTRIPVGFVSTNSICQGEQVGILWNEMFQRYQVKIHFAHRTFRWESEARGKAHVHVVILGFAEFDNANKRIYDYDQESGRTTVSSAANISPYLVEGPDVALPIRRDALCNVPEIVNGNKPSDGGFLLVEEPERDTFLSENPDAAPYVRQYASADDFINGERRYILWLKDAPPDVVRKSPGVMARLDGVRKFRLASRKIPTQRKADTPALFDQVRQPTTRYLVIPKTSSERRRYIPMAVVGPEVIASTELQMIPDFTLYHFGVLSSLMHMAWMRQVCGRLESRYRYSNKIVYNNYPWPQSPTAKQKEVVEAAAQKVLDVRAHFLAPVGQTSGLPVQGASGSQSQNAHAGSGSAATPPEEALAGRPEVCPTKTASLADLYDPLSMPPALVKAHAELDRAVDLCYRPQPFTSERQRVEYLFGLYEQLTAPLLPAAKPKRPGKRVSG